MFERYSFENPSDDSRFVDVGFWSYVAAGLMGSIYVLWKAGIAGFVSALLSHLFLFGALVAATGVTSLALPGIQQLVVLAVVVPAILMIQSLLMIEVVRKTYLHRGWIVHASN
jgi:hypothetical protein